MKQAHCALASMQLLKLQALQATYDPSTMAACRQHAQGQAAQLQQGQATLQQVCPCSCKYLGSPGGWLEGCQHLVVPC